MRVLFLLPLATPRLAQRAAGLASAFAKSGHDIHVLARATTRVRTATGAVLSKNAPSLELLRERLGIERLGALHGHLRAEPIDVERDLEGLDEQRVRNWLDLFRPDVVIAAGSELVADDVAFKALGTGAGGRTGQLLTTEAPVSLHLHQHPQKGNWYLADADHRVVARLPDSVELLQAELTTKVIRPLDAGCSVRAARAVLQRDAAWLTALLAGRDLPQAQAADTPTVLPTALPKVEGELESLKDGDVVFGDSLWIKGWIDWSTRSNLREIEVRVNERVQRVVPVGVRGEHAERLKNPDVLGFDVRLPLEGEGPPLKVALVLVHKDGRQQAWQRRFVWANDCIPARHEIPIVRGHATIEPASATAKAEAPAGWLGGALQVAEYDTLALVLCQRGSDIGRIALDAERPTDDATPPGRFRVALPVDYDAQLPLDLWIEFAREGRIHWLRCAPSRLPAAAPELPISGLQDGDVVRGEHLSLTVGPVAAAERLVVFVNGQTAACAETPGQGAGERTLVVPIVQAGNDVQVRIESDAGRRRQLQLWRHVDEPRASSPCSVVAVPDTSTVAPAMAGAGVARTAPRSVLMIRKAAAPTDELYVLAPLAPAVAQGQVRITIIDLDADAEQPADVDALLAPGTAVVISRYVSDRWIGGITRHKARLGPVFYLMDDDVAVAVDSRRLPGGYRQRMTKVACGEFETLIRLCDRFVVTSRHLHARYASAKTDLVEPPYLHPPKHLKHLDNEREILITYQGTEGHRDDLAALAPALRAIHDDFPQVRLQIIIGNLRFVPGPLKNAERCEAIPPMPWNEYKAFRTKARAHIAIAPILDTPYNRGKSIVKLFDISALGAVGLFTNSPPYDTVIDHGVNGLLLDNDPLLWSKALKWLVERPEEIRRMARASQELAVQLGDLSRLQLYWSHSLELRSSHA